MADTHRSVTKTVKTTVTLTRKEYEPILRNAVGAPDNADVQIEDGYASDIVVSWTETTHEGSE
jgi:hypothetical protein